MPLKYNSSDGFRTAIWGPLLWTFLHLVSMNFPVKPTREDKKNYMVFIYSLRYILPCGSCRKNLQKHLKKNPLLLRHMKSRTTFSKWMYDLHNIVNKATGKKKGPSLTKMKDRYELFRAKCDKDGCTRPSNNIKKKCLVLIVPDEMKQTKEITRMCLF
jgi:hypothetical protein